jgi:type IV secretion system protein VirB10
MAQAQDEQARQAMQRAEAERQRIETERTSARQSGVLMQLAGAKPASGNEGHPSELREPVRPAEESRAAIDTERDPNGQQRKLDFVGQRVAGGINPHAVVDAPSPYTLSAGSIISASLITGLNSDLPGMVTAQVTENGFDTATGRILLVPQGSRLVGNYDSVVAFGQKRALVVWQRLIFPDGSSIFLDNAPASDLAGYAGLSDRIDRHSWQLLKGVALSSLLGVGTEITFGRNQSSLIDAVRDSVQQSAARAGNELVSRNLEVQPTIKVRPGWPLRVLVHKDLVLRPWQG